ncbi:nuclear transport factor 2 family protein [Streptomyces sp. NPDC048197]|uniref:nuclear transport factor 2 family protein n=1 Tax=Streptomyces sp. NPDC048197 TaxID=3365511 RepID=UPI00371B6068
MTSTGSATAAMQYQLQYLTGRAGIGDLMDRCLRSLDEGRFDEEWARAFHTDDVTAEMPIGTLHGRGALRARVRAGTALFDRTVHLGTNPVIEIDGDRATVRGAQLSTHVLADGSKEVFASAGHTGSAPVRTADGRRTAATSLRIVRTRGTPPQVPADLGAPAP